MARHRYASPTLRPTSVLVSMPTSQRPGPDCIRMLEHPLAMRAELDSTWAVRPLALSHCQGRPALILEDQQGEPLARLLDKHATSLDPSGRRSQKPLPLAVVALTGLSEPATCADKSLSVDRNSRQSRRGRLCGEKELTGLVLWSRMMAGFPWCLGVICLESVSGLERDGSGRARLVTRSTNPCDERRPLAGGEAYGAVQLEAR